jgi:hypothetical protein
MSERNQEIANQVLADLARMNVGIGARVPIKTVWLRSMQDGCCLTGVELASALHWAAESPQNYLTLAEGGIAGMGSVALTESGYAYSRAL